MTSKQPVVILHGWDSGPEKWGEVKKHLEKNGHTVLVPSLPGFKTAEQLDKPFTLEDYVNWLDSFLVKKNVKNTILIGHSNGGRIAAYYLAHKKHNINKLVLIGSAGISPKNKLKVTFFRIFAKSGKKMLSFTKKTPFSAIFKKVLYSIAGETDYLNASPVMKKTLQNLISTDLTDVFKKITVPALIIWGKNDTYTPLWMGKAINEYIKGSRLEVLDAKHGLHLSKPHKLAELINDFLEKPRVK